MDILPATRKAKNRLSCAFRFNGNESILQQPWQNLASAKEKTQGKVII